LLLCRVELQFAALRILCLRGLAHLRRDGRQIVSLEKVALDHILIGVETLNMDAKGIYKLA
jgi:hypothetical protein